MLCQKCNHNNATVHFEQNINGKVTKLDLCSDCAKDINMGFDMSHITGLNNMFGNFWGDLGGFIHSSPFEIDSKNCSFCGTRLLDLAESSFLGCPHCYDDFDSNIEQRLKNYQRGTRHNGKRPNRLGMKKSETAENKPVSEEAKLRAELEAAVKAENYELAAKLRDKIKELGEK